MVLPPPPLLSTTTGWPSAGCNRSAMRRPRMSVKPPGGYGTTRRIGFEGQAACCADAKGAAAASAEARTKMRRVVCFMSLLVLALRRRAAELRERRHQVAAQV